MADIIKDYSLTLMLKQAETDTIKLGNLYNDLEMRAREDLGSEGANEKNLIMERYLDMRYEGQSYEIIVPFSCNYKESFHRLHQKAYGYYSQEKPVELVNLRLRARGIPEKPEFKVLEEAGPEPDEAAGAGEREIVFDSRLYRTRLYHREKLKAGNRMEGPAIILEYSSTIVVPPFAEARVDTYGNIVMDIK